MMEIQSTKAAQKVFEGFDMLPNTPDKMALLVAIIGVLIKDAAHSRSLVKQLTRAGAKTARLGINRSYLCGNDD
jgi:hypothetical protein